MNIRRIIREEIKNSTEEDWEWTEGSIDLKHILDIILEGSNFLILTAEEEADFWGHDDVTPGYEDLIFLYEKDEMSEGKYVTFKRTQTLEEVIEWVYNHINNSGRPQVVIDEFILLYDVIKNRAEKLFNIHAKSLYEEIIKEELEGFKDSSQEDWEWTENSNTPYEEVDIKEDYLDLWPSLLEAFVPFTHDLEGKVYSDDGVGMAWIDVYSPSKPSIGVYIDIDFRYIEESDEQWIDYTIKTVEDDYNHPIGQGSYDYSRPNVHYMKPIVEKIKEYYTSNEH